MLDMAAFYKASYGLYLVSSRMGDVRAGCVVNTVTQVTVSPLQMTVAIHKDNFTTGVIAQSGLFTVAVLGKFASMELIGRFGFQSSRDADKFAGFKTVEDERGVPYVAEQVVARFSCKVVSQVDVGTHVLLIGEVVSCETLDEREPMTYAYYHTVKNGLTPPKASSYQEAPKAKGYRCTVCGYVYEGDTLPPDFKCPICDCGPDVFVRI
ncbi:MAG: flavin reductase [Clostridia bacterium]